MLVSILVLVVIGFVVGLIAKLIMPNVITGGILITALLGIAGAFLGSWISVLLGIGAFAGLSLGGLLMSVVGAVIIIFVYRLIFRK